MIKLPAHHHQIVADVLLQRNAEGTQALGAQAERALDMFLFSKFVKVD